MKTDSFSSCRGILLSCLFGFLIWLCILIPACAHAQRPANPFLVDPGGMSTDTMREYQVVGDTLFMVESWTDARIRIDDTIILGPKLVSDWVEWIDRPAGRRRLIFLLTLIGEQKPCMIEVTTTTTHLEEVWNDKK